MKFVPLVSPVAIRSMYPVPELLWTQMCPTVADNPDGSVVKKISPLIGATLTWAPTVAEISTAPREADAISPDCAA